MKIVRVPFFTVLTSSLLLSVASFTSFGQSQIPFLKKQGTATQLIVDGKPFLILGGELHNSTSSSLDYMAPINHEKSK